MSFTWSAVTSVLGPQGQLKTLAHSLWTMYFIFKNHYNGGMSYIKDLHFLTIITWSS